MNSSLETIACPSCDCPDFDKYSDVRDRFHTIPDQLFQIVRCTRCGLLYLNPRPDATSIAVFYASGDYDPFASDGESASLFTRLYRAARPLSIRRKAARVVKDLKHGIRTLDVGCATGEFMIELRRRGFVPFGVEPDSRAAEFARERFGLTVWNGGIEQVPIAAGPFRLISFWHVLEHVHRLRENLQTAHKLLTDDGRVTIAVPNPNSWDAKAYGTDWVAWDTPRHLYHFAPEVMIDLLERCGFRAERAGAVAFDAFYHCLLSERGGIAGLLRGGMRGMNSYLRGIFGQDGSSELYFAYKK